jgi:hypothetical protein
LSSIKYGSTTFNLPDCNNRVLQGGERGYKEAGLPNITAVFSGWSGVATSGCTSEDRTDTNNRVQSGTNQWADKVTIDASLSNSIYGNSDTVQPPALCLNMIIKI